MKKITTKMILLMFIIPLLLVFSMVTTIDMAAIMIDVPVTSVEIEGEEILLVDIGETSNVVKLNAIVKPKEATNKNVTYTVTDLEGNTPSNITVSNSGEVVAKSTGSVRVVATADGGRQDSVQINFYSSKINSAQQINQNLTVVVGESLKITPGVDYSLFPANAIGEITYTASNNKIKVDKYTGEVTGLFVGTSEVTATISGIKYDNNTNTFIDTTYTLTFNVSVEGNGQENVLNFSGGVNESEEVIAVDSKTIPFSYVGYSTLGELSYDILEEDKQYIKSVTFEYSDDNLGNVKIVLKLNAPEKDYIFTVKAGSVELGTLTIKKQKPTLTISTAKTTFAKSNVNVLFGAVVVGLDESYDIRYESSNTSVFSVNTRDNEAVGKAREEGTSYITAKLYVGGELISVSPAIEFTVVDPYVSLGIVEAAKTFGLENMFIVGKYEYKNGVKVDSTYRFGIKAASAVGAEATIDYDKLKWSSNNTSVATVDANGVIKVLSDGKVTITVESIYNEQLQTSVSASFEINCIADAVNVYDYNQLVVASQNNNQIVLRQDIMLADGINSDNYIEYLNNVATKQMDTTADKSYYVATGHSEDAKIRYCLEITNNIYGNGFAINGDNITKATDRYGYSVFSGPLNLLALKYGNSTNGNAKIKAQDNIVFLVKEDNITITNVELKGCLDSSITSAGQTNLGKLDNVGTVLEVMGDNFSLNYSRVNNGRTVARIYGTAYESDASKIEQNPDNYKIEVSISNCILSYGREFILKVGSNQILRNESVYGEELVLPSEDSSAYDHAAPYFKNSTGGNYSTTSNRDDYFVDNYLMTDITLKDSVFYGAGLFCVGFESQFAGLALHGYDYGSYKFSELGWGAVAGTSYPARIKMQGDVRFYDWKEVSKIDSSTLIEGDTNLLETIGLDLNVSNLLNKFNVQNPGNKVVYKYKGNDYINGAIVFYGGGKNYSWVDTSSVSDNFNSLNTFEVPLSYFGDRVSLIYFAAGKENFRFMTYSSDSNINYEIQSNALADGSAYSWLIRK